MKNSFCIGLALLFSQVLVAQKMDNPAPALRHVVLFQFKSTASQQDVQRIEKAFVELKDKIDLIKAFEWGQNNSPEGLNDGLTHCFFATFDSEEDRDAYLIHPEHKAFVEILLPHLQKATVVDYWAK